MLRRQLAHFAIAGSLGFAIDAGLTQALVRWAASDPLWARGLAVGITILFTFAYNRRITFAYALQQRAGPAFARYLAGNAAGLAANLAAYVACLSLWGWMRTWPAVAVAVGALLGMTVNFVAARYFVFSRGPDAD